MHFIETEHGRAQLWWDGTDVDYPRWVLRYRREPVGSPYDRGRFEEAVYADPDDRDAALRDALRVLAREGVGAGRRLTTAQAAEVAGLGDGASWRGAQWLLAADGQYDEHTLWWWETTVLRATAARPGHDTRTDLRKGN